MSLNCRKLCLSICFHRRHTWNVSLIFDLIPNPPQRKSRLVNHMSTIPTLSREMTSEDEISSNARFAKDRLPWIIGLGAVLTYLFSLNHWISFASTAQIAKASGWAWQPELQAPLNWLI